MVFLLRPAAIILIINRMRTASTVRHYVNEGARRIVVFDLKNKRDVTRMRYIRKSLNCTAHAGDDQNNGGHVESIPANDRAHTTRYPVIFIDQWFDIITVSVIVILQTHQVSLTSYSRRLRVTIFRTLPRKMNFPRTLIVSNYMDS